MTAGRDEKWHMLIWFYALEISHEGLLIMLRHCDTQVALAHHRNNEDMLITDSSAGGRIKPSKQHLCCSLLVFGGDGQEGRRSDKDTEVERGGGAALPHQ